MCGKRDTLRIPKRNFKLQSAIEMLSVYSWAIIIIAMAVALVFTISGPFSPTQYLGQSCNIQPLMLCLHTYLAPYINSGEPIKFSLIFVNNMGVTLNFTGQVFNVTMDNVGQKGETNSTGSCLPVIAHAGTEIVCTAYVYGSVEPPMYSSVSSTFKIGYYVCRGNSCSGPYVSTGSSIQAISPGSAQLVDLSILTSPGNGRVVINGIEYSNGIIVPLEKQNYTIYAIPPSGYQFNSWSFSPDASDISDANSIQATISLSSNSVLTANFING
ncbi:MAG: hypothetical protein QXR73_03495 [Candidatus Micrarchaeaceae archaeon]